MYVNHEIWIHKAVRDCTGTRSERGKQRDFSTCDRPVDRRRRGIVLTTPSDRKFQGSEESHFENAKHTYSTSSLALVPTNVTCFCASETVEANCSFCSYVLNDFICSSLLLTILQPLHLDLTVCWLDWGISHSLFLQMPELLPMIQSRR